MVICFFIFLISLRRRRSSMPVFAGAGVRPRPQGARPSVIAALPLKTFRRRGEAVHPAPDPAASEGVPATGPATGGASDEVAYFETGEDGLDLCAICLSDYEDGVQVRVLPCRHAFHRECIDTWLARNNACPYCKRVVDAASVRAATMTTPARAGDAEAEGLAPSLAEDLERRGGAADPVSSAAAETAAAPPAASSSIVVAVHADEA